MAEKFFDKVRKVVESGRRRTSTEAFLLFSKRVTNEFIFSKLFPKVVNTRTSIDGRDYFSFRVLRQHYEYNIISISVNRRRKISSTYTYTYLPTYLSIGTLVARLYSCNGGKCVPMLSEGEG